jgi:hypothetical protein
MPPTAALGHLTTSPATTRQEATEWARSWSRRDRRIWRFRAAIHKAGWRVIHRRRADRPQSWSTTRLDRAVAACFDMRDAEAMDAALGKLPPAPGRGPDQQCRLRSTAGAKADLDQWRTMIDTNITGLRPARMLKLIRRGRDHHRRWRQPSVSGGNTTADKAFVAVFAGAALRPVAPACG